MRSPVGLDIPHQPIMQIISVPTVFTCKLPTAGWINLAQIRQLQFEKLPSPIAVVTWHNGDKQEFFGDNATAIMESWLEASSVNYRSKNRRNVS